MIKFNRNYRNYLKATQKLIFINAQFTLRRIEAYTLINITSCLKLKIVAIFILAIKYNYSTHSSVAYLKNDEKGIKLINLLSKLNKI